MFYRKGGLFNSEKKRPRRHKRHVVHNENGYGPGMYYPPPPQYTNGYVKGPPPPAFIPVSQPALMGPPPPVFMDAPRAPPISYGSRAPPISYGSRAPPISYATYHGPPPELQRHAQHMTKSGTISGPPPIVIPYGTVPVRADPRPVVHKSRKKRKDENGRNRSPDRRGPSQEFVVERSYDGIPVIRPVIYIDDDEDDRRGRSRSNEHRYKKKNEKPAPSPKIR